MSEGLAAAGWNSKARCTFFHAPIILTLLRLASRHSRAPFANIVLQLLAGETPALP